MLDSDFFILALSQALNSTCLRTKIGCILVNNGQVVSGGYNGAPDDMVPCTITQKCPKSISGLHFEQGNSYCIGVHAEARCLMQIKQSAGSILYTTHKPCLECTKLIIQAGLLKVLWLTDWGGPDLGLELRKDSNVEFKKYGGQDDNSGVLHKLE